jgi:myosin heavy subunit
MQRNIIVALAIITTLLIAYIVKDTVSDMNKAIEVGNEQKDGKIDNLTSAVETLQKNIEEMRIAKAEPVVLPEGSYTSSTDRLETARLAERVEGIYATMIADVSAARGRIHEVESYFTEIRMELVDLALQVKTLNHSTQSAATDMAELQTRVELKSAVSSASYEMLSNNIDHISGLPVVVSTEEMLAAPLNTIKQELDKAREQIQQLETNATEAQKKCDEARQQLEAMTQRIASAEEKSGTTEQAIGAMSIDIQGAKAMLAAIDIKMVTAEIVLGSMTQSLNTLKPLEDLPTAAISKEFKRLTNEEGSPEEAAKQWISPPLEKPTRAMTEAALGNSPYPAGSFMGALRDRLLLNRTDPKSVDAALEQFSISMLQSAKANLDSSTGFVERLHAAGDLPNTGAREASEILQQLLKDDVPMVRSQAALGLGILGDISAQEALIKSANSDKEEFVRCAAVVALGEIGDTETIRTLRDIIKKERSRMVRSRALESVRLLEQRKSEGHGKVYGIDLNKSK